MTDVQAPPTEWEEAAAYPGDPASPEPPADHRSEPDGDGPGGLTIRLPAIPVRKVAGLALTGIGLLIVLFLVYLYALTPVTHTRGQQALAQQIQGSARYDFSLVHGQLPAEGKAVAVVEIPSIGVHQVVAYGTTAADLMNGPGLMPGTALPGTPGNAVIAGRRVTFGGPFGALGNLHHGQVVRVVDGLGTFDYQVTRVFTVTAGQRDVITPTASNVLTLVTSDSNLVTSGRLVVRAKLRGAAILVTSINPAVPQAETGLAGDAAAGGLAMMWSFLTVIALVTAGLVAWRTRRTWLVYLVAAPVVLAFGLFACQSVARALPATF
jgi:sortase A